MPKRKNRNPRCLHIYPSGRRCPSLRQYFRGNIGHCKAHHDQILRQQRQEEEQIQDAEAVEGASDITATNNFPIDVAVPARDAVLVDNAVLPAANTTQEGGIDEDCCFDTSIQGDNSTDNNNDTIAEPDRDAAQVDNAVLPGTNTTHEGGIVQENLRHWVVDHGRALIPPDLSSFMECLVEEIEIRTKRVIEETLRENGIIPVATPTTDAIQVDNAGVPTTDITHDGGINEDCHVPATNNNHDEGGIIEENYGENSNNSTMDHSEALILNDASIIQSHHVHKPSNSPMIKGFANFTTTYGNFAKIILKMW